MQNYIMSEISLNSPLISAPTAHLDVSGMNIRSLSGCRRFPHLQSLICNNCAIANLEQILKLRSLHDLTHASFQGCPITHDPLYRASVIKWLPQLRHLDGIRISSRERQQAGQRVASDLAPSPSPSPSSSSDCSPQAADDESSREIVSLPPTPSPIRAPAPAAAASPPYDRKKYLGVDGERQKYLSEGSGRRILPRVIPAAVFARITPPHAWRRLQVT